MVIVVEQSGHVYEIFQVWGHLQLEKNAIISGQ